MVSRVYFEKNFEEFNHCEIITFNKFCAIPDKSYMRINMQHHNLVYNNIMKNLTYS